jgi:hypothetical protein
VKRYRVSAILSGLTILVLLAGHIPCAGQSRTGQPGKETDDYAVLMPADTEHFLYLNFKHVIQAPLFKKYALGPVQQAIGAAFKDFVDRTGLDLLNDIDRLVGGSNSSIEQAAVVAVLYGKFDVKKLTAAAEDFARTNKDKAEIVNLDKRIYLKVVAPTNKGDVELYFTFLDGRRMLLGTKAELQSALERLARKGKAIMRNKDVADAVNRLDRSATLTLVSSPKELSTKVDDPNTANLVKKISTTRLDVWFAADIKASVRMTMKDVDAAQEIKPMVTNLVEQGKIILNFVLLTEPKLKPLEELTKNLTIARKGRSIVIETSLSAKAIEALEKAAQEKQ